MHDILREIGATVAYGLVGIALMALSYLVVELTTPGRLSRQIWEERNRGAALLLSIRLLGVGAIVTVAIATSADSLGTGLVDTVIFGVLGVLLTTLAFYLLDMVTPGKLGAILVDGTTIHPAGWVVAAADLAVSGVICGAVS
ncbi:DUF350 domain-containing protein [Actinoallomurus sp. CA-150999]|uniref:DUF350 domain-containing protein n=1 Tax=Actinoallomurus sp. CA-150999 TaxID=3239887 RepID=UPI003D94F17E